MLLHLDRKHFLEWARGVLATTLGIPANKPLPPVIMQEVRALFLPYESDVTVARLMKDFSDSVPDLRVTSYRARTQTFGYAFHGP